MRSFQGLLFIALLTLQGILVVGAPEPLAEEPLAEDASPHSAEEVQEAREEFEGIDTNKDGFITKEEILEMDEVPEKVIYERLLLMVMRQGGALVSVAHRPSVSVYHQRLWQLVNVSEGSIKSHVLQVSDSRNWLSTRYSLGEGSDSQFQTVLAHSPGLKGAPCAPGTVAFFAGMESTPLLV